MHTDEETEAETDRRRSHGLICSNQGHTQFLTQRPGPEHILHELQHLPEGRLGLGAATSPRLREPRLVLGLHMADNLGTGCGSTSSRFCKGSDFSHSPLTHKDWSPAQMQRVHHLPASERMQLRRQPQPRAAETLHQSHSCLGGGHCSSPYSRLGH